MIIRQRFQEPNLPHELDATARVLRRWASVAPPDIAARYASDIAAAEHEAAMLRRGERPASYPPPTGPRIRYATEELRAADEQAYAEHRQRARAARLRRKLDEHRFNTGCPHGGGSCMACVAEACLSGKVADLVAEVEAEIAAIVPRIYEIGQGWRVPLGERVATQFAAIEAVIAEHPSEPGREARFEALVRMPWPLLDPTGGTLDCMVVGSMVVDSNARDVLLCPWSIARRTMPGPGLHAKPHIAVPVAYLVEHGTRTS